MRQTSELYRELLDSDNHWFETSVVIGEGGVLVDETGDRILFGNDTIIVATGSPESGFREEYLFSLTTNQEIFSGGTPAIGSAVAGEIDLSMISPLGDIPRRTRIAIFTRITDGIRYSEWLPFGVFYTDTRQVTASTRGFDVLTIHGYDAIILSDVTYPSDNQHDYPILDRDLVAFIASNMKLDAKDSGVVVDPRTWEVMDKGYTFPLPAGYTMREMLGIVAAAYGGNFVITDVGELRLLRINELPKETRVLINEDGYQIVFGSDKIRV